MTKDTEQKSNAPAGCAAVIAFAVIAWLGHLLVTNIQSTIFPPSHSAEIEKLDEMQANLSDLFYFFDDQKKLLVEQQATIAKLEAKSAQLKPIVDADETVVAAILAAHGKTQSQSIWRERGFSFLIGVISSLVASTIYSKMKRD